MLIVKKVNRTFSLTDEKPKIVRFLNHAQNEVGMEVYCFKLEYFEEKDNNNKTIYKILIKTITFKKKKPQYIVCISPNYINNLRQINLFNNWYVGFGNQYMDGNEDETDKSDCEIK